jgi:hypothetical protein
MSLLKVSSSQDFGHSSYFFTRKLLSLLTRHETVYSSTLQPSSKVRGDTFGMVKWVHTIGSGLPLYHIEYSSCPKLPRSLGCVQHNGLWCCMPDDPVIVNNCDLNESLDSTLTAFRKASRTLAKGSEVVAAVRGLLQFKRTASPHCLELSCHSSIPVLPDNLISNPTPPEAYCRPISTLKSYLLVIYYY